MGDVLAYSGALRRLAVEVGQGRVRPAAAEHAARAPGIAEIQLPAVQPGSSIMPGKVNPSVPEMVNQVCYQVFGCDAAILAAADAGQLELNVMMPVIAWNALHATRILGNAMRVLPDALRRRHRGRRGALPRAARSQHRGRDRAQPVHRLRRDGRHRQDVGQDRPADRATSCASASCCRTTSSTRILSPEAMTSPGIPGAGRRERRASRSLAPRAASRCCSAPRRRAQQRRSTARLFPPEGSRAARRAGPRRVAAPRSDHGRARDRRRQRRR